VRASSSNPEAGLSGFVLPDVSSDFEAPTLDQLEAEYWSTLDDRERKILVATRKGKEYLKLGQLDDALSNFDVADDLGDGERYLWQRGVTLFYLERYEDAFDDLLDNADLFEERYGDPASEERLLAAAAAKIGRLDDRVDEALTFKDGLPKESRVVLRLATDVFRGDADPAALAKATARDDANDPMRRNLLAHFYAGLYFDAFRRDPQRAAAHMALADNRANRETDRNNDITCHLPKLHIAKRKWHPVDDDALQRAALFQ